ncbi:MAG: DUF2157 domain-containing protein [Pseudomonas sp.]|jgi:uncharacterized membrane protein|nr:DUF2157 domain-containing protein [Pseudomonas sp.]MDD2223746.1 DUF2157 domain-containing protein [Pseudomonas sp.]MDY0415182.1 DUF2157 domain-containing protein [Pseudomonas sp.]NLO55052.1 DUF2157 domain-containing protein [Gammaproteobacteria bacterium]
MSSDRQQILDWVANGHLDAEALEQALAITHSVPSAAAKLRLLSHLVLVFAMLLLCSGVIFFFAYNWHDLNRYSKFAIAQGALLLSLLPLLWVNLQQPVGQTAIFAACLLVGALLALVGQTYQSGADSYQLFLVWALLITPWVVLARSAALWLLLLALLNLSVLLALDNLAIQHLFVPFSHPGWSLFALNAVAAGLWIFTAQQLPATGLIRWGERAISLYSLLIITLLAMGYIYAWAQSDGLTLPIWAACSALWLYLYRWRQLDLVMLSALIMAAIVLIVTLVAHALDDVLSVEGLFLLLSLSVIGLASAGAVWLRKLSQPATKSEIAP